MVTLAEAAPVAVFQLGITVVFIMWMCLYTIPAAQSVYDFTVAYENCLMFAAAFGLFSHALVSGDFYLVSVAATIAGVLGWVQAGFSFTWFVGDANQNVYRNITSNPNAGATVSQYNSQIALLVLCLVFVTEFMGYWAYVFYMALKDEPIGPKHKFGWNPDRWVAEQYWDEFKENMGLNSFTFHVLVVVGFTCVVLGMFVIGISANVSQMYLGPIGNTQFGNVFGVYALVRPFGRYPPNTSTKFYGVFFWWVVFMTMHGFGVGVSAANLWLRSQYVANQANRIDAITDKQGCVLSYDCYYTLSSSTTFYEFGVSVAYTTSITSRSSWANWSLVSFQLEIAAFVFGAVAWFVRAYWMAMEMARS